MIIPHISVSRKGVWSTCRKQYKYKYHLKLVNDEPEPIYFIYGTIVHKVAEEYIRANGSRLISEVANDILKGIIPLDDGDKKAILPSEYKTKFPQHLRAIEKITQQTGFGGELEYEFKFDLDPPHERYVLGFIDRLIQKGDKFWIIDYKTTKKGWWRKGPKDIVNDLQLRCYARVVQKNFGVPAENIQAALYYLDGAELVGARFTQESLDAAEKELLDAYIGIEQSNPDEVWGNVGQHCARCDYRKICTDYQNYLNITSPD